MLYLALSVTIFSNAIERKLTDKFIQQNILLQVKLKVHKIKNLM